MEIITKRIKTDEILQKRRPGLVAIAGPCANHAHRQIVNEGRDLAQLSSGTLATIHRIPPWKPRTPRGNGSMPWEGLETTNPFGAIGQLAHEKKKGIPLAIEIGKPEHIGLYSRYLTLAWLGARSLANTPLIERVARSTALQTTPIGVKNDLTGNIAPALEIAERINQERFRLAGSVATATVIFRGGSDFASPQAWEDQYLRALEATGGRLIVDTAHGGEMAHDPSGNFTKSIAGQVACMEHVIHLAQEGHVPSGIMIEASDFVHPNPDFRTDPNMPFACATEGILELHAIAMSKTSEKILQV